MKMTGFKFVPLLIFALLLSCSSRSTNMTEPSAQNLDGVWVDTFEVVYAHTPLGANPGPLFENPMVYDTLTHSTTLGISGDSFTVVVSPKIQFHNGLYFGIDSTPSSVSGAVEYTEGRVALRYSNTEDVFRYELLKNSIRLTLNQVTPIDSSGGLVSIKGACVVWGHAMWHTSGTLQRVAD